MSSKEPQDEDWELEEGVPKLTDPVVQTFFKGRDALFVQEQKHRSDADFRELLSPMAQEACSIVDGIRYEELQTVWTSEVEEEIAKDKGNVYPGMMFALAKGHMEETKLWKIVRNMPKGALLHCHLEAMLDLDWLFNEAIDTEGLHIASSSSLSSVRDRQESPVSFRYAQKLSDSNASLWSDTYKADSLIPLAKAAQEFPDGGRQGFVKWLVSRSSITLEESISHHEGVNSVWQKFISCFGILKTLIYYEPLYRKFLTRFFRQLMDDGVRYVDVRSAFAFEYRKQGSEEPEEGYTEVIRVFGEEIEKFQQSEHGKGFWGARMIWTTMRAFNKRAIVDSMHDCIEVKLAYPHLIAGFDLVGYEDAGQSLEELTPLLLHFRRLCAQERVNIPFFFHAGETATTGTPADQNLFDAMVLGTRRFGHAFSLYKHPLLMNMAKDRNVCVECCPVSNEVLRLTSSITTHPMPALLAHGVPVALCNDDPGILGQAAAGMSHDFYQSLQGIESLGLAGLGALAENSVKYAAFEDMDNKSWTEDIRHGAYGKGIRAQRLREWKQEWEKFVQWIILEFGVDLDLNPDE